MVVKVNMCGCHLVDVEMDGWMGQTNSGLFIQEAAVHQKLDI